VGAAAAAGGGRGQRGDCAGVMVQMYTVGRCLYVHVACGGIDRGGAVSPHSHEVRWETHTGELVAALRDGISRNRQAC
jgi:hypothetical protein